MAGALRDLSAEDLAAAAADASTPDASIVVVHVPADTIGHHDGDIAEADAERATSHRGNATIGGNPIGCDALHRLLCDTRIEFSIDVPDGRTIGIHSRAGPTAA